MLRLCASLVATALLIAAPGGVRGSPTITSFGASETAVSPDGGSIVLFGSVRQARTCDIAVTPRLPGFPRAVRCSTRIRVRVRIPAGAAAVRYRFTLVASTSTVLAPRGRTSTRSVTVMRSSSNGGGSGSGGSGSGGSGQAPAAVTSANGGAPDNAARLGACPSGAAFLDHAPADPGEYVGIEPLGHMNGMHVLPDAADHVYVLLRTGSSGSLPATVLSPGNVTVLQVVKIVHLSSGVTDYEVDFSTCASVMFWFQHVATLVDPVASALTGTPRCISQADQQTCTYSGLSIKLSSGQQIGTAGGPSSGVDAFDFGAADIRTPALGFIDQAAGVGVTGDTYRHGVCPLDYFAEPARSALYAQLESVHPGANGIPKCGATMQDKAGTLAGNWYLADASGARVGGPTNVAGELAFAHWNLDTALGAISTGTHLVADPFGGAQLTFMPQTSGLINREPTGVVPDGQVYCFDGPVGSGANGPEGHFDVELKDATTLAVDFGYGACAATPALTNSSTYVR